MDYSYAQYGRRYLRKSRSRTNAPTSASLEESGKIAHQIRICMTRMATIFDLKLPEGTKCTALTILEPLCVVGAFDVPGKGIEIYALNPNTGKNIKVEYL